MGRQGDPQASVRPLVMRDEQFLDELRARTRDDYFDFQPFARQYLCEALGLSPENDAPDHQS